VQPALASQDDLLQPWRCLCVRQRWSAFQRQQSASGRPLVGSGSASHLRCKRKSEGCLRRARLEQVPEAHPEANAKPCIVVVLHLPLLTPSPLCICYTVVVVALVPETASGHFSCAKANA